MLERGRQARFLAICVVLALFAWKSPLLCNAAVYPSCGAETPDRHYLLVAWGDNRESQIFPHYFNTGPELHTVRTASPYFSIATMDHYMDKLRSNYSVVELSDVAIGFHALVRATNSSQDAPHIFAWGRRHYSQIGIPVPSPSYSAYDADVGSDLVYSNVTSRSTGADFTRLASNYFASSLVNSSGLYMWGDADHGLLADGADTQHILQYPVKVAQVGSDVRSLHCKSTSCAVITNAVPYVAAWGLNANGLLCLNSTAPAVTVPSSYPNTDSQNPFAAFLPSQASFSHTASLWYSNITNVLFTCGSGSLLGAGSGYAPSSYNGAPVVVPRGNGGIPANRRIIDFFMAVSHAMVLTEDGILYGWGSNAYGQLAVDVTAGARGAEFYDPLAIDMALFNPHRLIQINGLDQASVALTSTGKIFVWGQNSLADRQLGFDANGTFSTPTLLEYCTGSLVPGQRWGAKLVKGAQFWNLLWLYKDNVNGFSLDAGTPQACSSPPPVPTASCQNGVWIIPDTVSTTIVVTGPVIIIGDIDVPGDLTIEVPGRTFVNVTGCARINGSLVVELDDSEIEDLTRGGGGRQYGLLQSNCTTANVNVEARAKTSSCRRLKSSSTETNIDGRFTLTSAISVDNFKCKIWWIILVSVVGGVLLIILILSLLAAFCKPFRRLVRPFSKRNEESVPQAAASPPK